MLNSNKNTNYNKTYHFKAFVYVSYYTYDFTIWYNSYDTHTVSYNSWAFTICQYDTKLFIYNTILTTMDMTHVVRGIYPFLAFNFKNIWLTHSYVRRDLLFSFLFFKKKFIGFHTLKAINWHNPKQKKHIPSIRGQRHINLLF